jgi:hypothetical protein
MFAIAGRDHGRGAFVMHADLMQFFVQLRRTGDGQRREKSDNHSDANTGARLHASSRFSRCETLRKFFEPSGSVQENSILFLFLLLSLFRWEIAEGLLIGMADLGRAGC